MEKKKKKAITCKYADHKYKLFIEVQSKFAVYIDGVFASRPSDNKDPDAGPQGMNSTCTLSGTCSEFSGLISLVAPLASAPDLTTFGAE